MRAHGLTVRIRSVDPDLAGGRLQRSRHQADCRGLAAAIRANQSDALAARDRQAQGLERNQTAVVAAESFGDEQTHRID
jgi:hypothetical protein